MKRITRLLLLIGAIGLVDLETSQASTLAQCSCAWTNSYWMYVWENPHCGNGSGGIQVDAYSPENCFNQCYYWADTVSNAECNNYHCGNPPIPYISYPTQYQFTFDWSYAGGGSGNFGPVSNSCS